MRKLQASIFHWWGECVIFLWYFHKHSQLKSSWQKAKLTYILNIFTANRSNREKGHNSQNMSSLYVGSTDLLGSFSLNKKFHLSIASSVRRPWTLFVFSYQNPCRQVDMLAFSYLFCVMIKTLKFPRILFVSDAGHFWYVAALKIGPIGGCFFYFSFSRVFLSLNGLLLTFLFICPCFVLKCSKPMEKGQCPDCKKVIGGEQHRFLGEYKISDR